MQGAGVKKAILWDAAFREHTLVRFLEPTEAMEDAGATMFLIQGRFIAYGKCWVRVAALDGDYSGKLTGGREVEILS